MIRRLQLGLALCSGLALTSVAQERDAHASNYFQLVTIVAVGSFANSDDTVWVQFSAAIPGQPGCVTSGWNTHLAFRIRDASDPNIEVKGKTLLSLITSAMLAGKQVDARGTGSCTSGLTWGPGAAGGGSGAPTAANVELLQQFLVRN
jgi:hypothetical protein